jgi:hypothetical protein
MALGFEETDQPNMITAVGQSRKSCNARSGAEL